LEVEEVGRVENVQSTDIRNGMLAIQSLRLPRSSEAWFGVAVPAQRALGFTDFDECSSRTLHRLWLALSEKQMPRFVGNIDSWKYSMPRLEGRCSIQLSYEQTEKAVS
jgi:hypothetical protein